jgi:hypothetical protein
MALYKTVLLIKKREMPFKKSTEAFSFSQAVKPGGSEKKGDAVAGVFPTRWFVGAPPRRSLFFTLFRKFFMPNQSISSPLSKSALSFQRKAIT